MKKKQDFFEKKLLEKTLVKSNDINDFYVINPNKLKGPIFSRQYDNTRGTINSYLFKIFNLE